MRGQIRRRLRAAKHSQIRRDVRRQRPGVEALQPLVAQSAQSLGQHRLAQHFAFAERPPFRFEGRGISARLPAQFRPLGRGYRALPRRHHHARLAKRHRIAQQPRQRQRTARRFQRRCPSRNRPGYGVRCQRPAKRHRLQPGIQIQRNSPRRAAAAMDAVHRAVRLMDHPEPVAADPGHMRIDHRQTGCDRDGRLHRIAAILQHGQARLRRKEMRRSDHAL